MRKLSISILFVALAQLCHAQISNDTTAFLEGKTFVCKSMQVNKRHLNLPDFLKEGDISEGKVSFPIVNSDLVQVVFEYKIANFNATHTYKITNGYEHEFLKDLILTEDNDFSSITSKEDPFEVSIATRVKVKRGLISSRVSEIWLKKSVLGVKNPFKGKDLKCRVAKNKQNQNFQKLYTAPAQ